MPIPFVDRPPSSTEVEKFRLVLSTYQDGSGMIDRGHFTLPGWRDFERSVAAAFGGITLENKWIYDVLIETKSGKDQIGISCKMRGTLRTVQQKNFVTIELTNASGKFWDSIKEKGFTQESYDMYPDQIGSILIDIVEGWHSNVGIENGGTVDTSRSFFLTLQWYEKSRMYQLFQFPINLPDPSQLHWEVRKRRLIGMDSSGTLFEWYGLSGGQLKYYPPVNWASWRSKPFSLEPLPENLESGLQNKAKQYFPAKWNRLSEIESK